jgi:outer membrane lipoprotein-sorting protein
MIGVRRLTLFGVALAAIGTVVSAAAPPTVDSIVADYVRARGGLEKIRSVQTLRQTGRAIAEPGREAPVLRELKRPNKIRFEFTVQGITAVYVSDGNQGWQVSPFEGDLTPRPLPEEAVMEAMEQADIEGPIVDWKLKGHKLELAGTEVVNGREAYKLKLTLKSGDVRFDYIDVKSHYLVRTESTRQIRGQDVQLQTTFTEHKKAAGVLFPRSVEVEAAGRPKRLRVVVDKIEVNPPLSDARFTMPSIPAHE